MLGQKQEWGSLKVGPSLKMRAGNADLTGGRESVEYRDRPHPRGNSEADGAGGAALISHNSSLGECDEDLKERGRDRKAKRKGEHLGRELEPDINGGWRQR